MVTQAVVPLFSDQVPMVASQTSSMFVPASGMTSLRQ
jgi:hypothetical protein